MGAGGGAEIHLGDVDLGAFHQHNLALDCVSSSFVRFLAVLPFLIRSLVPSFLFSSFPTSPITAVQTLTLRLSRTEKAYQSRIQTLILHPLQIITSQPGTVDEPLRVWELLKHLVKGINNLSSDLDSGGKALGLKPVISSACVPFHPIDAAIAMAKE